MLNMLRDTKITRLANDAVAGTSLITSSVLDMQGYDSVLFIALLGDITATSVLLLTAKGNTANSTTVPTPLAYPDTAGYTAGATDADNKMLALDIQKPRERYVFCTLARTIANAVVDGIIAIQYNSNNKPNLDATLTTLFLAWATSNDPTGV